MSEKESREQLHLLEMYLTLSFVVVRDRHRSPSSNSPFDSSIDPLLHCTRRNFLDKKEKTKKYHPLRS